MKIEFTHKHEYDDKAGQWRVKETKATSSSNTSLLDNAAMLMNVIRGK